MVKFLITAKGKEFSILLHGLYILKSMCVRSTGKSRTRLGNHVCNSMDQAEKTKTWTRQMKWSIRNKQESSRLKEELSVAFWWGWMKKEVVQRMQHAMATSITHPPRPTSFPNIKLHQLVAKPYTITTLNKKVLRFFRLFLLQVDGVRQFVHQMNQA